MNFFQKQEKKRSFTVVDYPKEGETFGRYMSKNMTDAANKAIAKLSKKMNIDSMNNQFITFWMKETTRNSDHKEVRYIGTRVKLHKPIIITRGNNDIEYKYKYIVTKYDEQNFKIN